MSQSLKKKKKARLFVWLIWIPPSPVANAGRGEEDGRLVFYIYLFFLHLVLRHEEMSN